MNSKNCKPSTSTKQPDVCPVNDERPSSSRSSGLSRINASFADFFSTFAQCFTSKRTSRGEGYNSRMAARRANEASTSSFIRYYDNESDDDDDIPPPPLPPKKRVYFSEVPTVTRNVYYCDEYPDFEEIFIGPQNAFEKPSSSGTLEIPPPAKMLSRGAAAHPRR